MLAIIIAWIVISFVLLSFGDMFISLYNKLCKQNEDYNLPDTFILGMCFVLIPLSLSSFWLPSNHYILLAYLLISITYWLFSKKRFTNHCNTIKNTLIELSRTEQVLFLVLTLSVLGYVLWSSCIFDAAFYHHQNIRWNEEYAIVPGLGNLESRFGFNSNYLLFSAIFSFRFVFNDAIYALQSILFLVVSFWIFKEVIKSQFNAKHIILLLLYFLFFFINRDTLADSSTDIIPNICTFYFLVRFTLYPEQFKKKFLLIIILPISLATFKLSTFPFCLFSLFTLIYLVRKKEYKTASFCTLAALLIVMLWLIRNVIITGYLVYPFHELDIFDFDWKMPLSSAIYDRVGIHGYARKVFLETFDILHYTKPYFIYNKLWLITNYLTVLSIVAVAATPIPILYSLLKQKKVNPVYYLLYGISVVYIIYWAIFSPDFRFGNGVMIGVLFLTFTIILQYRHKENTHYLAKGNILMMGIVFSILFFSSLRFYHNYNKINSESSEIKLEPLSSILYKPYNATETLRAGKTIVDFTTYKMSNGIIIYMTNEPYGRCLDKLPATCDRSPKIPKAQNIETLEARGNNLQMGFRPKK